MTTIIFLFFCWLPLLVISLKFSTTSTSRRPSRPATTSSATPLKLIPEPAVAVLNSIVAPITMKTMPQDTSQQQIDRSSRQPWRIRILRKRQQNTNPTTTTALAATTTSPPAAQPAVITRGLTIAEVDPWGLQETQSHMNLPSWACKDEAEERHLAAMKIVLQRDLQKIEEKRITRANGQRVRVVEAFPDVYSDFRLLRFLRKDKVQDPVTAAVRYREFLQWRDENHVDEIRLLIEERLRAGDKDAFRPPEDWKVVYDYIPCDITPLRSNNGLVPVVLQLGKWDTKGITKLIVDKKLSLTTFFAYWTYILEALNVHLYQESIRTKQMVFVEETCDLTGTTLSQLSPAFVSHVLKPWIRMTQSNYPETTKSITFLRPSKVFSFFWKFLSPMFSKGTIAKVSMKNCSGDKCFDFYPESVRHHQPDAPSPLYKTSMSGRLFGHIYN